MSVFQFPKGFFWGAATSSHQVEGGNRNDWAEWEPANAERLAREAESKFGRLPNWPSIKAQAQDPENYISGRACDHYHRFREDFDIAKRLGHNAHRFSIEWSRIEPEEGKFDEVAIEHYREVIRALRERGMEPFVTLWHWTIPLWVRDQGGWENPKTVRDFARYAERLAASFSDLVMFWMPLNEPSSYIGASFVLGLWPPQVRSLRRANGVFPNLVAANREAYRAIHSAIPRAVVGVGNYLTDNEGYRGWPHNRLLALIVAYVRNWRFLNAFDAAQDFIGVQYYHHDALNVTLPGRGRWGPIETRNENRWANDLGWEVHPEGIYRVLKAVAAYRKPIYITENGTADADDDHRGRFIGEHTVWIARAIQEGVQVRGYFHWSLLDNFEWDKGFWLRFGLVEIDYQTLERKIRPSAWEYKKIIEANVIAL